MIDVIVLGHVTKDVIKVQGRPDKSLPGGSALYVSVALKRMGCAVKVVTKLAQKDESLLAGMRGDGIEVINRPSKTTTIFENSYSGKGLAQRAQRVLDVAEPFTLEDVPGDAARALYLGPLTRDEMSVEIFQADHFGMLALDGQGLLRRVEGQAVLAEPRPDALALLAKVDILKVDDQEARTLLSMPSAAPKEAAEELLSRGVHEVAMTFADRGSLITTKDDQARIPAFAPAQLVDATGCGDTFMAGYLCRRIKGDAPSDAARFAAGAASLKLEGYGPFNKSPKEVRLRIAETSA